MPSLSLSLGAWIVFVAVLRPLHLGLPAVLAVFLCVFAVCWPVAARLRNAPIVPPIRRWYDVPLRASLVAVLVASVVGLSTKLGPTMTGLLAIFPVVLVSLAVIFHRRVGGRGSAAITANAIPGLAGYGVALTALHLLAVPAGTVAALTAALAIALLWNLSVLLIARSASQRASAARPG